MYVPESVFVLQTFCFIIPVVSVLVVFLLELYLNIFPLRLEITIKNCSSRLDFVAEFAILYNMKILKALRYLLNLSFVEIFLDIRELLN